jgi:Uma2 family endonuclease
MTTEELLALPENGTERWLIAGVLRERPMTRRNRFHSFVMTRTAQELANWLDRQPAPRGQVLTGDAGVRLRRDPDTTVGVDIAYVAAEVLARQPTESTIVEGAPVLAVEILSPNDTVEEVNEKIDAYLRAGVALVWVIDTYRRTVTAHRPDAEPALFNVRQELTGAPHLPGFTVAVRRLFE